MNKSSGCQTLKLYGCFDLNCTPSSTLRTIKILSRCLLLALYYALHIFNQPCLASQNLPNQHFGRKRPYYVTGDLFKPFVSMVVLTSHPDQIVDTVQAYFLDGYVFEGPYLSPFLHKWPRYQIIHPCCRGDLASAG